MNRERKIGWLVLLALAMGGLVIVAVIAAREAASLHYTIIFQNAKGLREGDRVQMSGVDIGVVKSVELSTQPANVAVTVKINPKHAKKILGDSTALIRNVSLPNVSGQMIVEVLNSEAQPPAPPMQDGAIIDGMDSLLGFKAWQLKNAIDINSESLVDQLDQIRESLEAILGDFQDLAESPEVRDAMRELRGFLMEMQEQGRSAAEKLAQEWPHIKERLIPVLERVRESGRRVLNDQFDQIIRQIEDTLKLWGQPTPTPTPTPVSI